MTTDQAFLSRLAIEAETRIVLLVLDGVGDLRTAEQPRTALDRAVTPNLDQLAARSALGRIVPVQPGVTPGSGPGHLALFGYDPAEPATDIGRGVLEALGLGLEIGSTDLVARGNFATADADGDLTDRRAGRPSNDENRRACELLQRAVDDLTEPTVRVSSGEGHRFVLTFGGDGLSAEIEDTDPQATGVPPLPIEAADDAATDTVSRLTPIVERLTAALADEPAMNRILLRGFSSLPHLPQLGDLHRIRCGAFAGYPLYRGVASVCGMEVVPTSKKFGEMIPTVSEHWDRFDYFFLHVKQTDMAGEDGDLDAKVAVLEEVDGALPELLALGPEVIAITGDHSTPAPLAAHSWHPVPLLVHSPVCFIDDQTEFNEVAATAGHLGTLLSRELMGLLLANAGRLAKFGA